MKGNIVLPELQRLSFSAKVMSNIILFSQTILLVGFSSGFTLIASWVWLSSLCRAVINIIDQQLNINQPPEQSWLEIASDLFLSFELSWGSPGHSYRISLRHWPSWPQFHCLWEPLALLTLRGLSIISCRQKGLYDRWRQMMLPVFNWRKHCWQGLEGVIAPGLLV